MTFNKTEEEVVGTANDDMYGQDGQLNTLVSPHVENSLKLLAMPASPQTQRGGEVDLVKRTNVQHSGLHSRAPPRVKQTAIKAYVSSKANTASKNDLSSNAHSQQSLQRVNYPGSSQVMTGIGSNRMRSSKFLNMELNADMKTLL